MRSIISTIFAAFVLLTAFLTGSLTAQMLSFFGKNKKQAFINMSFFWARFILFVSGIRIKVSGIENLTFEGNKIYIANHQGNFDIPVLLAVIPSGFNFFVKKELSKVPFLGSYIKGRQDIVVDRHVSQKAHKALKDAAVSVAKGNPLVIFPEGTRSFDGQIGEFKKGCLIVAKEADAKLVPISISGSFDIQRRGSLLVRPAHVTVNIGQAVDISDKNIEDTEVSDKLIAQLRQKIVSLLANN